MAATSPQVTLTDLHAKALSQKSTDGRFKRFSALYDPSSHKIRSHVHYRMFTNMFGEPLEDFADAKELVSVTADVLEREKL